MAGGANIPSGFLAKGRRVGELIAHGVGIALFALLWLLAFAPVALAMKLTGRKFLPKFTGSEDTYFLPKERIEPTLESMRKQG
jgi:hypothetical protein